MPSCPACGASVNPGTASCGSCGAPVEEGSDTVRERGFRVWLSVFNYDLFHGTYRMELAILNVPFLAALPLVMRFLPTPLYTGMGWGGRRLSMFVLWVVYNGVLARWYGRREHGILFRD